MIQSSALTNIDLPDTMAALTEPICPPSELHCSARPTAACGPCAHPHYLTLLHAGYRECGYQKLEGTAIFPSSLGRCFSSSSFSGVQSNGFKRLNLEGATVFNSRHALADELTRLEIVPSNPSQAMLADSFAMGMNTSTAHLFGEKNVRELAHWGAYNRHGEAGGLRRKAAAIERYTQMVFPPKKVSRKRKAPPK